MRFQGFFVGGSMNFDYENLDWQMYKYHRAQKMAMHGDSVFCVRRQQTITFVNGVAYCMCLEGKLWHCGLRFEVFGFLGLGVMVSLYSGDQGFAKPGWAFRVYCFGASVRRYKFCRDWGNTCFALLRILLLTWRKDSDEDAEASQSEAISR